MHGAKYKLQVRKDEMEEAQHPALLPAHEDDEETHAEHEAEQHALPSEESKPSLHKGSLPESSGM